MKPTKEFYKDTLPISQFDFDVMAAYGFDHKLNEKDEKVLLYWAKRQVIEIFIYLESQENSCGSSSQC